MDEKISKVEIDLLSAAIDRIVMQEVLEDELLGTLPKVDELNDSNKIYRGKVSVLFVDMRESTKLPEKYCAEQLVKIYRSYIRVVVQAIRYSGGVVRDFMGDGVLALFIDDTDGTSEDKAVHAARYITTVIDKLLNPVLDKKMKHRISCGIGIHTGEISLSKVGMRGKEQREHSENEFGIAWIGNSTNLACKQSSAVECGTIFISASTYVALSNINKNEKWEEVEIFKGTNALKGYIAQQYYLLLDEECEPCIAKCCPNTKNMTEILDEKIEKIIQRTEKLNFEKQKLDERVQELTKKEKLLNERERTLNEKRYSFYCEVLRSGHCKEEYVKIMGQDFWEENLDCAISAGKNIGKSEKEVKQDVSYCMVSIYESLELYDKAYDFVVEQANGCDWLHLFTVQEIVNKVKYCSRLQTAICERLEKNDLSNADRDEFEKIKKWIMHEYKL